MLRLASLLRHVLQNFSAPCLVQNETMRDDEHALQVAAAATTLRTARLSMQSSQMKYHLRSLSRLPSSLFIPAIFTLPGVSGSVGKDECLLLPSALFQSLVSQIVVLCIKGGEASSRSEGGHCSDGSGTASTCRHGDRASASQDKEKAAVRDLGRIWP